jgi:hypothetical protein
MRELAIIVVGGAVVGYLVAWAFGFDPVPQGLATAGGAALGGTRLLRQQRVQKHSRLAEPVDSGVE